MFIILRDRNMSEFDFEDTYGVKYKILLVIVKGRFIDYSPVWGKNEPYFKGTTMVVDGEKVSVRFENVSIPKINGVETVRVFPKNRKTGKVRLFSSYEDAEFFCKTECGFALAIANTYDR